MGIHEQLVLMDILRKLPGILENLKETATSQCKPIHGYKDENPSMLSGMYSVFVHDFKIYLL